MYQPNTQRQQSQQVSNINISKRERYMSLAGALVLITFALERRNLLSVVLALISGRLVYRGLTGHSDVYEWIGRNTAVKTNPITVSVPHQQGIHVVECITIQRSPEEIYTFWRKLENLPRFMQHIVAIQTNEINQSHWKIKAPMGMSIEWDAEIIHDVPNEVIGWHTLQDSQIDHAGSVRFKPVNAEGGTEVCVTLEYALPAGRLAQAIATIFWENPQQQIKSDLRRLKQILEVGEVAITEGQHGRE